MQMRGSCLWVTCAGRIACPGARVAVVCPRWISDLGESGGGVEHGSGGGVWDFSRARAKAKQGDTDGAIQEYLKYFEENPKSPAPYFAAARWLESENKPDLAVGFYKKIMRHFEEKKVFWAEAALRLAALYDNTMNRRAESEKLLREIVNMKLRVPQRQTATDRLMQRVDTTANQ